MNNDRRKQIEELITKAEALREAIDIVENEEIDAFDNLPESLQESERGQSMQEASDSLADARFSVDDVLANLTQALG